MTKKKPKTSRYEQTSQHFVNALEYLTALATADLVVVPARATKNMKLAGAQAAKISPEAAGRLWRSMVRAAQTDAATPMPH